MFTRQQTFDIICNHLLTQNEKSRNGEGGACKYRDRQGNRCAVGVLIPKEKYDSAMEGQIVNCLSSQVHILMKNLGHDIDLLSSLQVVHDSTEASDWGEHLRLVAKMFGLEFRGKFQSCEPCVQINADETVVALAV